MNSIEEVKEDLMEFADSEKAEFLSGFFKAVPGGYGEGDRFIGVRVPDQRKVAKKHFKNLSLKAVKGLLTDPIHEYRLTALIILVHKYQKAKSEEEQKDIVDLYLKNIEWVNNWDLVDSSADKILGAYLFNFNRKKTLLYELAESNQLWKQRIAIISTFYFIKKNEYDDTLEIAEILLDHQHDLIHKAVGWMLREVGKRDVETEMHFLQKHYKDMPRTMLRYAIEKFDPNLRKQFLKGLI